jgi:hypothetical protein
MNPLPHILLIAFLGAGALVPRGAAEKPFRNPDGLPGWPSAPASLPWAQGSPADFASDPAQGLVLVVPLHQPVVGVVDAKAAPHVVVQDSEGTVLADVVGTGGPASDGVWYVDLSPGARLGEQLMLQPGMQVAVDVAGLQAGTVVPRLQVHADVETNTVTGSAPGFQSVSVNFGSDPDWYGNVASPDPVIAPVATDGSFSADVSDRFDVAPGTFGAIVAQSPDGNYYADYFAPAAATVEWTRPYTIVRADADATPVVSLESKDGRVYYNSLPGYPLGGSLFAVLLFDPDDPGAGAFQVMPGDHLVLDLDGDEAFRVPLPAVSATLVRAPDGMVGEAPDGARVTIRVAPNGPDDPERLDATGTAGADGFHVQLGAPALSGAATAEMVAYGGGPVAHAAEAVVDRVRFELFGSHIEGATQGRGSLRIELLDGVGMRRTSTRVETDLRGVFSADLTLAEGDAARLQPGDTLRLTPDRGAPETRRVVDLSAAVSSDGATVMGRAPAGVRLMAQVYTDAINPYSGDPYGHPFETLTAASDAGGIYRLTCRNGCPISYGRVVADLPDVEATFGFVAVPQVALNASRAVVMTRATSGTVVSVTYQNGGASRTLSDLAAPLPPGGAPGTNTILARDFPEGLHTLDTIQVVAGARHVSATMPVFNWAADVVRNTVSGTGPALRPILVAAVPPNGDARNPYAVSGQVGKDGRWAVAFGRFDLRPGDDLRLLVGMPDYIVEWDDGSVEGPEPTSTPPRPPEEHVYLPLLGTASGP